MAPKKEAPLGCDNNHVEGRYSYNLQTKPSIGKYDRQSINFDNLCIPSPASYYSVQFPGINTSRKFAKVLCPFHDDTRPSLSINLEKGWYKCFSCGAKGGGIEIFHMTRYALTFKQTIKQLEAFNAR
jgi:hypothetical protein